MRCTQKYKVYTVFNITMGLLLILISEHIMNISRQVFLYISLRREGDSEIPCEGLEVIELMAGLS